MQQFPDLYAIAATTVGFGALEYAARWVVLPLIKPEPTDRATRTQVASSAVSLVGGNMPIPLTIHHYHIARSTQSSWG
jgi:hypothetical protein